MFNVNKKIKRFEPRIDLWIEYYPKVLVEGSIKLSVPLSRNELCLCGACETRARVFSTWHLGDAP